MNNLLQFLRFYVSTTCCIHVFVVSLAVFILLVCNWSSESGWNTMDFLFGCIVFGIGLFVIDCLTVGHVIRMFRTKNKVTRRTACDLTQFIAESKLEDLNENEIEFIQNVRICIAFLANVPVDNIYPDDTFKDTMVFLPFWDSLDMIEVYLQLEEVCDMTFTQEFIEHTGWPDYKDPNYTVADFVRKMLESYRLQLVENGHKTES